MIKYTENLAKISNGTPFSGGDFRPCSNAFDGIYPENTGDIYHSWMTNKYPNYLGFNFNTPQIVDKIRFYLKTDQMPTKIYIQVSNDGTNYTTLYTNLDWKNTCGVSTQLGITEIILNNRLPYKYYRLYITEGNSDYIHIGEMELWGIKSYLFLIQDNNNLYSNKTGTLQQIGTGTPTKANFQNDGVENINLTEIYLNKLSDNAKVLMWTDDMGNNDFKLNKNVNLTKPYIQTLKNPKILCYTENNTYKPKLIINGNEKSSYKYKVENIESGTVLKDYGFETSQDTTDNIVIPFSTMKAAPNNPFHIKVSALNSETGKTITNTGTVMFYDQAPTCVVQPIDGRIVHMLMGDPDNDKVRYQILLNGEKVYPTDGEWSPLIDAGNVNYALDINKVKRNVLNTFRLKVQDEFGVQQSDIVVDFIGSYYGLMFYSDEVLPDGGHYYSDDLQRVLNKIFMGTIVAGEKSPIKKVYVKNLLGYDIQNVNVALNSASSLPTGCDVLLDLQESDFVGSHSVSIPNILHNGDSVPFYIQVVTDILEETGGEFTITVNSESVT